MAFLDLLNMTCTVVQAATATGSYGQTVPAWSGAGVVTTTGVACRMEPPGIQTQTRELATGAALVEQILYLDYATAPTSLRAHGASSTHRITAVARAGVAVDAGPFDVLSIQDGAGAGHHLRLELRRAG